MSRQTGRYRITSTLGEQVRAFVPYPLPPAAPPLVMDGATAELHAAALTALSRLGAACSMVPSTAWFIYGFVRKEAVITSQIEGTQATLRDILTFEVTERTDRPADVQAVCNYVDALAHARGQLADPRGLPLSSPLLCDTHRILMRGVRGEGKLPGKIRRSQNWIGGSRPGQRPPLCRRRPRTSLTLSRRWSGGCMTTMISRRWSELGSRTCSSRRFTHSSMATDASAGC